MTYAGATIKAVKTLAPRSRTVSQSIFPAQPWFLFHFLLFAATSSIVFLS
jgi:hypothetical protein